MASQLQQLSAKWGFSDAMRELPKELSYDPGLARSFRGRELTPGELGCFASHFAIWRSVACRPDEDAVCVLEDDVIIEPSFFEQIGGYLSAVPQAEYVRLHAKLPVPFTYLRKVGLRHLIRFRGSCFGTQGYLLRPRAARKLVSSVGSVVRPVDDEMDRFWSHGIPNLAFFPFPLMERGGESTIEPARHAWADLSLVEARRRLAFRAGQRLQRGFANLLMDLGQTRRESSRNGNLG